jgi:hypothetical protein
LEKWSYSGDWVRVMIVAQRLQAFLNNASVWRNIFEISRGVNREKEKHN